MIEIYLSWLAVLVLVVGVSVGLFYAVGGEEVYNPKKFTNMSIAPSTGKLVEGYAVEPIFSDHLTVTDFNLALVESINTTDANRYNTLVEFDKEHVLAIYTEPVTSDAKVYVSLLKKKTEPGQFEYKNTLNLTDNHAGRPYNIHFFRLADGTPVIFGPTTESSGGNRIMAFFHPHIADEKLVWTIYKTHNTLTGNVAFPTVMLSQDKQSIYLYSTETNTANLYRYKPDGRGTLIGSIVHTVPLIHSSGDNSRMFPLSPGRNIIISSGVKLEYVIFNDSDGRGVTSNRVFENVGVTTPLFEYCFQGYEDDEIIAFRNHTYFTQVEKIKVGVDVSPDTSNIIDTFNWGRNSVTLYFINPTRIDRRYMMIPTYSSGTTRTDLSIFDIKTMSIVSTVGYNHNDNVIYLASNINDEGMLNTMWFENPVPLEDDLSTGNTTHDGFRLKTYYVHPETKAISYEKDKGDYPVYSQAGDSTITRQALGKINYYPNQSFIPGQAYFYKPDGTFTVDILSNRPYGYIQRHINEPNKLAGVALEKHRLLLVDNHMQGSPNRRLEID